MKNISFLCLEKLLDCYSRTLWVIFGLCRGFSPVHFSIHLTTSISSDIINNHYQLRSSGSRGKVCYHFVSIMLARWCRMSQIISFSFPSKYFFQVNFSNSGLIFTNDTHPSLRQNGLSLSFLGCNHRSFVCFTTCAELLATKGRKRHD